MISNFLLLIIAVTVPCSIPVSKTLILFFVSFSFTSPGDKVVAKSISSTVSPDSDFLTQPPTNFTVLSSPILFRYEKIICASFIFSKNFKVLSDPNFLKIKRSKSNIFFFIFLTFYGWGARIRT